MAKAAPIAVPGLSVDQWVGVVSFLCMGTVRPTLRMLRELPTHLLPDEVNSVLARLRAVGDPEERLRVLTELRLDDLHMRLLQDARARLETGLPSKWVGSDRVGLPVYEVRDRSGRAWRGGVVIDDHTGPWLVHAVPHDRTHLIIDQMRDLHAAGKLLPTALDLRLRDEEARRGRDRVDRVILLRALLGALHAALGGGDRPVDLSRIDGADGVELAVGVSNASIDDWDPGDAHQHVDILSLTLVLRTADQRICQWILATCLPFLQADKTQIETHWGKELTVTIMLTRARLVQLLADENPSPYETLGGRPSPPSVLHYADRNRITRAFVQGDAIRAVCGEWWVPIGDHSTHPELPLCSACESELPAAQVLKELMRMCAED